MSQRKKIVIWLGMISSLCLWWQTGMAQETVPVLSVHLEMKARDADVLFKKDPYDRSTFPVSMLVDGKQLNGRISVKGSFSRSFDKKSLKIKLDKGSKWRGQRRIALNAMATDTSMMREWLAWDLIHTLGMAAPKVNYTQLYINRRYIGMFLHIEWIDPGMLAKFGLGDDGEFFHPLDSTFCGDLGLQSVADVERCWTKLSPRDNDYSPLKKLVKQLHDVTADEFDSFLEKNFDVESVINWIAVNAITSNGDTYNKNYFIYFSRKKGRWVLIPWDYDLSFGRNWDEFLEYPANILNDNFQYYYPLELGLPNPLKDKLLKNPVLLERLKQKLRGLMGMPVEGYAATPVWFTPEVMHDRIDALTSVLTDNLNRERYTTTNAQKLREQASALKDYVSFRYNYLRKTVLQVTNWVPDRASIKVSKAGETESWVDGFGKTLGTIQALSLNRAAEIAVDVERMTVPEFLPEDTDASRCVKRTWFLVNKTPFSQLNVNLSWQYLHENSRNTEVGKNLDDESKLNLWVMDYEKWRQLPVSINKISNVIETKGMDIKAGRLYRFVACQE